MTDIAKMDIALAKVELRQRMRALRDALDPDFRLAGAEALVRRRDDPAFRRLLPGPGGTIAGYLPIRSEIDPRPLMAQLRDGGFRLALPRITEDELAFHLWTGDEALVPGPFGTSEPAAHWPIAAPDLFLTPLLAFDAAGGRLGYGRGHYDRAFATHPAAHRVGLAFAMLEVPAVPSEPHDVRLDLVLTGG